MGYQESAGRRLEAWVATYSSMLQPGFEIGGMKKPMSENLACRFEAEAGTNGSAPQHRNAMRVLVMRAVMLKSAFSGKRGAWAARLVIDSRAATSEFYGKAVAVAMIFIHDGSAYKHLIRTSSV